ncbi:MAG: hypothetical protein LBQ37_03015 [Elusimicrobiota bacterium]|jgi:hypothetical protein|nr:hypothetical protein [Elusimicrobiota bacterium]
MKKTLFVLALILTMFSYGYSKTISAGEASLVVPDDWSILEVSEPMLILAQAPQKGNFSTNVALSKEVMKIDGDAETQKELSIRNLQSIFTDIKLIESKENYWIFENSLSEETTEIRQIQYFYVKNNNVYILTFSAEENLFNSSRHIFEKIEKSLVLEQLE